MKTLIAVRTGKTKYKFINVKQIKEDLENTAFWVLLIGMFLYCLYA